MALGRWLAAPGTSGDDVQALQWQQGTIAPQLHTELARATRSRSRTVDLTGVTNRSH